MKLRMQLSDSCLESSCLWTIATALTSFGYRRLAGRESPATAALGPPGSRRALNQARPFPIAAKVKSQKEKLERRSLLINKMTTAMAERAGRRKSLESLIQSG